MRRFLVGFLAIIGFKNAGFISATVRPASSLDS